MLEEALIDAPGGPTLVLNMQIGLICDEEVLSSRLSYYSVGEDNFFGNWK